MASSTEQNRSPALPGSREIRLDRVVNCWHDLPLISDGLLQIIRSANELRMCWANIATFVLGIIPSGPRILNRNLLDDLESIGFETDMSSFLVGEESNFFKLQSSEDLSANPIAAKIDFSGFQSAGCGGREAWEIETFARAC